jgi:flagellin
MRINHNVSAINTYSRLVQASNAQGKSLEKLSSGLRINKAGDDAAGLAISEKMRNQIRGLDQATRNAQDGISMIQTAEGALNETHSMLLRIRELSVQANNDTNTDGDRANVQAEITQLQSEITSIGNKTEFNTKKLLDGSLGAKLKDVSGTSLANLASLGVTIEISGIASGAVVSMTSGGSATTMKVIVGNSTQTIDISSYGSLGGDLEAGTVLNFDDVGVKISIDSTADAVTGTYLDGEVYGVSGDSANFQIGANADQMLSISVNDMRATAIGTATAQYVSDIDVTSSSQTFDVRLAIIDDAISDVSTQRSNLGAWQNRLEHTINNLTASSENLTAAESRVRDVDMAKEMMEFSKNNILAQASTAMLAQANQQPQGVLQLLR